ncbi:MAG: hypothetical protein Q8S13_14590, partial [Dehalococcoidia bacterium]|nr:hypothetical protein [Dehalococcoidia bacterium]
MRDRGRSPIIELEEGEPRVGEWRIPLRHADERLEVGSAPPLWGVGENHLGTVLDLSALRAFISEPQIKPVVEVLFGSVASVSSWLDRLSWANRFEAWTRYTPAGASIEAELTVGGGH